LTHLDSNDHDKIWNFVNEKVDNIEGKIKKVAEEIKRELHQDIRTTKEEKAHE
jgi:hypothetical protein